MIKRSLSPAEGDWTPEATVATVLPRMITAPKATSTFLALTRRREL